MRKKLFLLLLTIICCVCLAFGISACSGSNDDTSTDTGSSTSSSESSNSSSSNEHEHNLQAVESVAATCTTDGNIAYWYCNGCGKYFSDSNGTTKISQADTVIAKLSHIIVVDEAVAATCTSTGLTEGSHCSVCNSVIVTQEIVNKLGHSFTNYISDNNATCTNDGTKTATCDHNGCSETNTITDENTALGHAYNTDETSIQWKWTGYTYASATFVCNNNNSHKYTINATITNEITKEATCQNTGIRTYTATVTYENNTYKNTKTESLEITSHSLTTEYREDEDWIWGYTVTRCENCSYEYETAVSEISLKTFKNIGSGLVAMSTGLTNVIIYKVEFNGGYGELTYNFKVYASRDYTNEPVYYEYNTSSTQSFTFYCPYATTTENEALQNYVIVITVTDSQGHSISLPLAANFGSY